jgi:hypothetical protein
MFRTVRQGSVLSCGYKIKLKDRGHGKGKMDNHGVK